MKMPLKQLRQLIREENEPLSTNHLTVGDLLQLLRDVDPYTPVFTDVGGDLETARPGDVDIRDAGGYSDGVDWDDYNGPMCVIKRDR